MTEPLPLYCMTCRAIVPRPHDPCPSVDTWHRVHLPNIEDVGPATYKAYCRRASQPVVDKPHVWRIR